MASDQVRKLSAAERCPSELWRQITLATWERPTGAPSIEDEVDAAWIHVRACYSLALTARRLSDVGREMLGRIRIVGKVEASTLPTLLRSAETTSRSLRVLVVDIPMASKILIDNLIGASQLDLLITLAPISERSARTREILFAWDDFDFSCDFSHVARLRIDIWEGLPRLEESPASFAGRWAALRTLHLGFGAGNADFAERAGVFVGGLPVLEELGLWSLFGLHAAVILLDAEQQPRAPRLRRLELALIHSERVASAGGVLVHAISPHLTTLTIRYSDRSPTLGNYDLAHIIAHRLGEEPGWAPALREVEVELEGSSGEVAEELNGGVLGTLLKGRKVEMNLIPVYTLWSRGR